MLTSSTVFFPFPFSSFLPHSLFSPSSLDVLLLTIMLSAPFIEVGARELPFLLLLPFFPPFRFGDGVSGFAGR